MEQTILYSNCSPTHGNERHSSSFSYRLGKLEEITGNRIRHTPICRIGVTIIRDAFIPLPVLTNRSRYLDGTLEDILGNQNIIYSEDPRIPIRVEQIISPNILLKRLLHAYQRNFNNGIGKSSMVDTRIMRHNIFERLTSGRVVTVFQRPNGANFTSKNRR